MSRAQPTQPAPEQPVINVEGLYTELEAAIAEAVKRFEGIDRADAGFEALMAAQERLKSQEARDAFAKEFLTAHGLWEFLYYDPALKPFEANYKWLAKVYQSVQPPSSSKALLWHRLGQKTLDLVHGAITEVTVTSGKLEDVVVDEEIIDVIKQLELPVTGKGDGGEVTAEQVLETLEGRLKKKLEGKAPHPVWKTLSDRLEDLRRAALTRAEDSVDFLKRLLQLARETLAADKAEAEGKLDEIEETILNPNIGALTQIFREYAPDTTPDIVAQVVQRVDSIADLVRGTGWKESHPADRQVRKDIRMALKDFGLPPTGELFARAYEYVRENY